MADSNSGRHRSGGRYNPVSEFTTLVARAGESGAKATAVLAASGGLVTAFALPAQAAQPAVASTATKAAPKALAPAVDKALAAKPAVVAPAAALPAAIQSFGVVGAKAVAKPKPKPVVAAVATDRSTDAASRSTTRTSVAATAPAPKASSSAIVNIARSLLGIYYVYGGTTPAGFDCSGFTSYVYRQVGISLPRTAAQQQSAATRVSNPVPGDLVFWGYPAYHVGIYSGNGMVIDSSKAGYPTRERAIWGSPMYGRF